jgi:integrase
MYQIPDFDGPFKEELTNFILHRRSLGYDYGKTVVSRLAEMNKFFVKQGINVIKIPADIYMRWIQLKDGESTSNQEKRYHAIHGFSRFLISRGYPDIYDTENHVLPKNKFIPYIFSDEEIAQIFKCADCYTTEFKPNVFDSRRIMPILLRLLYSTGLRISEALSIRLCDVCIEKGIIYITDGKNHVGRNVVLSFSMKLVLENYMSNMIFYGYDGYLFQGCDGRMYTANMARIAFYRILGMAGIRKRPSGKYPRLHDFRHLFSVRALEQMAEKGYDLYTSLPILCKYLGHKSIIETEYYIHLTKDRFTQITHAASSYAPNLFPDAEVRAHE